MTSSSVEAAELEGLEKLAVDLLFNGRHGSETADLAAIRRIGERERASVAILSLITQLRALRGERDYAWSEMKNALAYWRAETAHAEAAERRAEAAEAQLAALRSQVGKGEEEGIPELPCADAGPSPRSPDNQRPSEGWRPEVVAFARLMERQLKANDHKGGWGECKPAWLWNRMREEGDELWNEIWQDRLIEAPVRADPERVGREAADVANFALMIADVCGALAPVTPTLGDGGGYCTPSTPGNSGMNPSPPTPSQEEERKQAPEGREA